MVRGRTCWAACTRVHWRTTLCLAHIIPPAAGGGGGPGGGGGGSFLHYDAEDGVRSVGHEGAGSVEVVLCVAPPPGAGGLRKSLSMIPDSFTP
jgi:hypothetical protein